MDYSTVTKSWDDFKIGDYSSFAKTITNADVVMWCGLTGDMNPIHLDREYSKTTRFKDIIVPGIYILGFVSATLSKLAVGGIYASQDIRFLKPVYINDTISTKSSIIDKLETKHLLKLRTHCVNQKDEIVMHAPIIMIYIPSHWN